MAEESTTPDLEDLARRGVEAFARGDAEAAVTLYSRGAVFDMSFVGADIFEGYEAIRGLLEDWVVAYEEYEAELEEFRELGNDATFAVLLHRGRLIGSSGFIQLRHSYTLTWADGCVERNTVRADIEEARAAAERLAQERG